ncbi:MAG: ribbon-helix-helix domain-containing protein [Candidatus Korarchaeum sp.]|nr:ribbon-helix-helix domain-containing protein [Candidatus Korarchaeum sp.]MDW8035857.1 ribbon-helix-helix domain-containing protein [Candidatus Korarchaeum sp.]
MAQQVVVNIDEDLIKAIDALVLEGNYRSRSEAIRAALLGFIRSKNAERVKSVFEDFISQSVSDFRK